MSTEPMDIYAKMMDMVAQYQEAYRRARVVEIVAEDMELERLHDEITFESAEQLKEFTERCKTMLESLR